MARVLLKGMSTDSARAGERKREVLDLLDRNGPLTTAEIADATGVSPSWVRDLLSRARGNGYVESVGGGFVPGKGVSAKEHDITERGRSHLSYIRG